MFSLFHAPRHYPKYYEEYYDIFNFYHGRDAWLISLEGIPREAVMLFCLHWCELEVQNGGLSQYFYNSTGVTYPEAAEGFRKIGMLRVADILHQAAAKLGQPFPFDIERRRDIVGDPPNGMDFGSLDAEFWDLASADTIFRAKPKFVPFAEAYAEKWQRNLR
jgi:hypothetical protein